MPFDEYNATVMDHFLNPRNTGELKDATAVATVKNEACGDTLKLSVKIDAGRVVAARTKTFGCTAAIASASALTELLVGRSIAEARAIRDVDIVALLGGLPPEKEKCSLVGEQAIRAVLGSA